MWCPAALLWAMPCAGCAALHSCRHISCKQALCQLQTSTPPTAGSHLGSRHLLSRSADNQPRLDGLCHLQPASRQGAAQRRCVEHASQETDWPMVGQTYCRIAPSAPCMHAFAAQAPADALPPHLDGAQQQLQPQVGDGGSAGGERRRDTVPTQARLGALQTQVIQTDETITCWCTSNHSLD